MKFFSSFLALAAVLGFSSAAEKTCASAGCKSLSDDLLHRSMNLEIDPCEDFDQYVCGNWAKHHPLPDSAGRISYFSIINDHVIDTAANAVPTATDKSKSHAVRYLADMYNECMDTKLREERGTKPLVDAINDVIGHWPLIGEKPPKGSDDDDVTWSDMYVKMITKAGLAPAIRFAVQYNPQLGKKMLLLTTGIGGMPGQFLMSPNMYQAQIDAYKQFMHETAIMMGAPHDAHLEKRIAKVISLEKELAMAQAAMPFNIPRMGTFGMLGMTFGEDIDMLQVANDMLKGLNSTQKPFKAMDQVVTLNMEYIQGAVRVFQTTPLEVVRDYFGWLMAINFGTGTSHKFRHALATFRSTMTGIKSEVPDKAFCSAVVNTKLQFVYARVYVDAAFTKEDRAEATLMVKELKNSFRNILKENKWLDEPTKLYALKKLDNIKENIGYPDWLLKDLDLDDYYSNLKGFQVSKGKFLEAFLQTFVLDVTREFNEYSVPFNHERAWPMTPATVNAAYMPVENSITIPAAILNTPFFDRDRPLSMNYGSIGAVIGHEMTHGFDNNGRRFDETGKRHDWWSNVTEIEFTEHASCFIKQYSAIHVPAVNLNVSGSLTLGENIADNGGLKESWFAYQAHQQKIASEVLPDMKYTADQLFFISFGRNWCSVINKQSLANQIKTNPHTPDAYRTLTVLKNSPEFAKAFNCAADTTMNPTKKCAVW